MMMKSKEQKVKQVYGVYAFVRKDFMRPPMPDIARTLKATKYDSAALIEYQ